MSVQSGSTLGSIVPLELFREGKFCDSRFEPQFAEVHAKFWGKSLADEEQKWCNAQPPMPVEGSGYEPMDVDVSEEEEEDDVIDGCYFLELDIEISMIPMIWIRAEYIRIYDAVESCGQRVFTMAPAAVITGQPGIGKSMWIYYALRRRLAERKAVIWYMNKKRFLFVEEGVYQVPDEFWAFRSIVWTLVDSDHTGGIPEDLVMHNTRHFVIYCTSPSQNRWARLNKTVEESLFIMNPWKIKEILRVIDMLPPRLAVDRGLAIDTFNQLGPTPRICINLLRVPARAKQYEDKITKAISTLTTSKLQELLSETESLSMDATSHKICLITRQDREHVDSLAAVSPITSSIKSRLANHFRTLDYREQIHLYKLFSKVPASRTVAGIFFEAGAQRRIQDGVELEIIPMVRLASSTSSLPKWRSSHVTFLNDVELERLRQQALQKGQPLMIPKGLDIEEYTKNGPSSPITSNVIYVPGSTNKVAFDSFIILNNVLYIFQFTIGKEHQIKTGLIDFLDRHPELPSKDNWRFIFIVPPNRELVCPQPRKANVLMYKQIHTTSFLRPRLLSHLMHHSPPPIPQNSDAAGVSEVSLLDVSVRVFRLRSDP